MYDLYIPDGLPELSRGGHPDHTEGKACIMELVSFLSQDEWSDNPATVHPVLRNMAIEVNDRLPDEHRYLLNPLISWFFSTNERELNVPLLEYLGILDVTEDFNWSQMDWATTVNSVATEKFGHETPLSMAESEEMVDWLKGALEIADVILTEVRPYQITDQDIVELRSWLDLPPNTLLIEGAK